MCRGYLEEVNVLHPARPLCIDGVLSNVHEGPSSYRGSGGDAGTGEQVLLHQVHPPDQQVGVAHRAAPHAAVHLNQAGASRRVLQLYMEHPLKSHTHVWLHTEFLEHQYVACFCVGISTAHLQFRDS